MKHTPSNLSAMAMVLLASFADHGFAAERPNIVMLFIDDWAWNGTPIQMDDEMPNSRMPVLQMPNLEKLVQQGMKFRNAYASPQCSPSRVCLQTGQSSPRNGFTVYLNQLGQDYYNEKKSKGMPVISCIADETIDPDAVTIPEALEPLGYVSAHFGKWTESASLESMMKAMKAALSDCDAQFPLADDKSTPLKPAIPSP